jgi:hypothetical protein
MANTNRQTHEASPDAARRSAGGVEDDTDFEDTCEIVTDDDLSVLSEEGDASPNDRRRDPLRWP